MRAAGVALLALLAPRASVAVRDSANLDALDNDVEGTAGFLVSDLKEGSLLFNRYEIKEQLFTETAKLPINSKRYVESGREEDVLGEGGFGITYLAKDTQTDKLVAMKFFHHGEGDAFELLSYFTAKMYGKSDELDWASNECDLPKQILAGNSDLPEAQERFNLCTENGVHNNKDKGLAYLVLEYAGDTNLLEYMQTKEFSKEDFGRILKMMLEGIHQLKATKYVHRDIKLENTMVFRGSDSKLYIKIIDFGLLAVQGDKHAGLAGTMDYIRPKQVAAAEANKYKPSWKDDIYATGIMMYELMCGWTPTEAYRVLKDEQAGLDPHNPLQAGFCDEKADVWDANDIFDLVVNRMILDQQDPDTLLMDPVLAEIETMTPAEKLAVQAALKSNNQVTRPLGKAAPKTPKKQKKAEDEIDAKRKAALKKISPKQMQQVAARQKRIQEDAGSRKKKAVVKKKKIAWKAEQEGRPLFKF